MYVHIYLYMYIHRERERDVYVCIYIYIHAYIHIEICTPGGGDVHHAARLRAQGLPHGVQEAGHHILYTMCYILYTIHCIL